MNTEASRELLIAGVDEVGRGPLAGPVVAAAVILDPRKPIEGLADSKTLSAKKREQLFIIIQRDALAWGVGRAEVEEIDCINILQASFLAMQRAVAALRLVPDHVLVDGNRCPILPCTSEAIIKGDAKHAQISAASIIAKVLRDREMQLMHSTYPHYGFDQHVGYPTRKHLQAIEKHGVLPIHRKTFGPVRRSLEDVTIAA